MSLSAKLQLRQSQSLVMTPQLLQSIRLLQYSQSELASFVEAEVERNPLLESGGGDASRPDTGEPSPAPDGPPDAFDAPLTGRAGDGEAIADGLAARLEDVSAGAADAGEASGAEAGGRPLGERGAAAGSDFEGTVEDLADRRPSLHAHAAGEIAELLADPIDRRLAEALAEHLDEAGYLRLDAPEPAIAARLGVSLARLESVLARLQAGAEPAGLFARDLAECLAVQLRRRGRLDPVMEAILANLDLLARRDFAALKRLTGEDEEGLLDALAEIRSLDPKPGHAFESAPGEAVVPDVVVDEAPEGGWRVELNPEALPRVLVSRDYAQTVGAAVGREEERAWLAERQQSAQWLVRSLDQRARTILKVAVEIARRQDGFLAHGLAHLRPMTLATVAEAIGMHESTVSRVTNNKYVATPRGTFEMKFFFTNAIPATGGGDAHSAEAVKLRIRLMIEGERDGRVFSDDEIAEKLTEDGIDVARRTVAKYREGMGIASSIQRRREMKARRLAS